MRHEGTKISHLFFDGDFLLFTEATTSQIEVVENSLSRFAKALRQKVNFAKSKIFSTPNTPEGIAVEFTNAAKILRTGELGDT